MDYISAIVDVIVALIGFGGGLGVAVISQKHTDKRHDEDIDVQQSNSFKSEVNEVKAQSKSDIDALRVETMNEFAELKDLFSEMKASYQNSTAVLELKIDSLEKKQDKHNSVIERTFKLEERMSVTEEKVSVANKRIADLERHEEKEKNN